MRKSILITALGLGLVAGAAFAQTDTNASMKSGSGSDAMFVKEASAAGLAEVSLGQLGQSQGQSDQVKQFGAQMVKDHTAANQELSSIASQKGLTVSQEPMPKDAAAAKAIGAKQGAAFDSAFGKKMLMDHKKAVALFQKEANNGKDADLKAFAAKTLPTLKDHLQMAEKLPGASGSSKAMADMSK